MYLEIDVLGFVDLNLDGVDDREDVYSYNSNITLVTNADGTNTVSGSDGKTYLGTDGRGFYFMSESERCFLNIDLGANKLRK